VPLSVDHLPQNDAFFARGAEQIEVVLVPDTGTPGRRPRPGACSSGAHRSDGPAGSSEPLRDSRRAWTPWQQRDPDDDARSRRVLLGSRAAGGASGTADSSHRRRTAGRTVALLLHLQGISQGAQVSHEVLDVYEHGIEANALKNYYNSER
jgi:hypothetical protein